MKIKNYLFAFIFTILMLCSCDNNNVKKTIIDRDGYEVTKPDKIEKIVSLSTPTTQLLIDLGLEDKIIAVDSYSKMQNDLKDLPELNILAPDNEFLLKLNPDVIFASGMSKVEGSDPFKVLRDMGISVFYVPASKSLEDIKKDILFVSELCGEKTKGLDIVKKMETEINKYKEIGSKIKNKKTVYFEIGAMPDMVSFGDDTFLNDIIELVGAENILKGEKEWIAVSPEIIVKKNPDVIITNVSYIDDPVNLIKSFEGFKDIKAVKNNEVYYVDNVTSSSSNHRIISAVDEIAKAIYPKEYNK